MPEVHPLRVLLKALALIVLLNLGFAALNPSLGRLSLYNGLVPGRPRFPYEQDARFFDLAHAAPVFEDFDAMFGSHTITAGPKPPEEYRIFLIGDSGTWGYNMEWDETLSEQINKLGLRTCEGKTIRAFNLAYPAAYLPKDLLILDRAMQYQPDLIIWPLTLWSFMPRAGDSLEYFMGTFGDRPRQLAEAYELGLGYDFPADSAWRRSIIGQRRRLNDIFRLQMYAPLWGVTRQDFYIRPRQSVTKQRITGDDSFAGVHQAQGWEALLEVMSFEPLEIGHRIAGEVPLLIVNEPIYRSRLAHSDVRYNERYPRWAYDDYRTYLAGWMEARGYPYLDLWQELRARDFSDAPFHYTPDGERKFAEQLGPSILAMSCTP